MTLLEAADLACWRSELGASSRLWGGDAMRHEVGDGYWLTLSGAPSIDYNLAVCHASMLDPLRHCLAAIAEMRARALVMTAGEALGSVATLVDDGWACVGAVPFMALDISMRSQQGTEARPLDEYGLELFRALVADAFKISPSLARLAIPDSAGHGARDADPSFRAFGLEQLGELVSGVAIVDVGSDACVWSMATPPTHQRRGYGRRLLEAVLDELARGGSERVLLIASDAGAPLYESIGFRVVEHWQVWSRPRWMLA